jgi:hypothetical protein
VGYGDLVANTGSVTFFGSGTQDSNPVDAPVTVGDVASTPAITGISPATVVQTVPFTLVITGVGFNRRTPVQVRVGVVAAVAVNAGFTDTRLTATFPTGVTPNAAYNVFVDSASGAALQSPTQLTVTA